MNMRYCISFFTLFLFVFNPLSLQRITAAGNNKPDAIPTAENIVLEANIAETDSKSSDDENDEEELNTETIIPEDFTNSLDYLLHNWAVDKNSVSNCKPRPNPATTEEQYKERLKTSHVIEMPYNSAVKSFIDIYTQRNRKQVEYLLGLSNYYFPIFEAELEAAKLPLELKYLPIIESALNPRAISGEPRNLAVYDCNRAHV